MKIKKIIKLMIIPFFIALFISLDNYTSSRFVIKRYFNGIYSSYPFYFDASTSKSSYDYSDSIPIIVDIINNDGSNFNFFDTDYEVSLEDNAKFELKNSVNGVISGNALNTNNEQIEIVKTSTESIKSTEQVTIVVKSIKPYAKEVKIPIKIKSEVENIYSFMEKNSRGSDISIDFQTPTTQETSGIYMNQETIGEEYPVYYYRGTVNNSVIYANHCWQIVRTTEYGGVKLVYDGKVNSSGECVDDHDRIGSEPFESKVIPSPADVGYMYGYEPNLETLSEGRLADMGIEPIDLNDAIQVGFFYGKDLSWDSATSMYTISGESVTNNDLTQLRSEIRHKDYYTCLNSTGTCESVYYIYHTGDVEANADGTYTLTEFTGLLLTDGKYLDDLKSLDASAKIQPGYLYGNDVSYDGSMYTLVDTIKVDDLDTLEDEISPRHHYTCLNDTGTCESAYYIYYNTYGTFTDTGEGLFAIKLNKVKNITEELGLMLYNSSDTYSTNAKEYIDKWFVGQGDYDTNDMTDYLDDLDDVVYCNERTISGLHGWDKDTNNHLYENKYLHFTAYKRIVEDNDRPILTCSNPVDSFTTSTTTGNGKLTYPVGMLTVDEARLAGGIYDVKSEYYLSANRPQLFMTPYYVSDDHARMFIGEENGRISSGYTSTTYTVRPVIAIKENFKIVSGTGEPTNPYIIEKY